MPVISMSVLEGEMLELVRRVEETGEEIVVTDNGRPVVKLVPIRVRTSAGDVFADVRGRVVYHEDIVASTIEDWRET
jgi:prevent-host-death family protein